MTARTTCHQRAGRKASIPAPGCGSAGNPQAGIKGTDTLAFVVDILGVDQPS